MSNPQEGNRIILLSFAIVMALAALMVPWGIRTLEADELLANMFLNGGPVSEDSEGGQLVALMAVAMDGSRIPLTAWNGNLPLGPLKIPNWQFVVSVIAGLGLTLTNHRQFSDVPRIWVKVLLYSGIVAGAVAEIILVVKGTPGIGGFLLITAGIIGLTHQSPLPGKTVMPPPLP